MKALKRRYGHGVAAYRRGSRAIQAQLERDLPRQGWLCPGKMENGPGKRFVRCGRCDAIDYEKSEGDRCNKLFTGRG